MSVEVWGAVCLSAVLCTVAGAPSPSKPVEKNLLANPAFDDGLDKRGIPKGWHGYGTQGQGQRLSLVRQGDAGKAAMLIEDDDATRPFGVSQTVPIEPGQPYTAYVRARAVASGSPAAGTLVLRLGKQTAGMEQFGDATTAAFTEFFVSGVAGSDTRAATVYVYSRKQPNCRFLVDRVRLVKGKGPARPKKARQARPSRRQPGLEAQPPPVYTKLKDLHLTTTLVEDGKPNVTIVAPASGVHDGPARDIARAIRDVAGVDVPIVNDESPQATVPTTGNLIVLGNRSTSKTIEELYNRHFTLLDLRYPGTGGHVVRTLHNPFGNGSNVVLVGGSDTAGVVAAARQLVKRLRETGSGNDLTLGWIADIQLPPGLEIPTDMNEFPLWSASMGYKNSGVFGWTVMTKRAALYYMTGDPFHAREFLRLSFPDAKAKREIRAIDKGKVDVTDPLTGLDHYRAHRLILYWDLIEESPVFTDEQRLRVTNAFARQLKYRSKEGVYRHAGPAAKVSSRHGQWGAVCVYTLCRYFARDYPDEVWKEGLRQAQWEFASLHKYNWVHGENDNLFWYTTSMEPLTNYLLLSGDRVPIRNGVFKTLMTAQDILLPGTPGHRHLYYGALNWFHKVAYLLHDGRWLFHRDRTDLLKEPRPFRLGQSYWPGESLTSAPPADLVGRWTIDTMPKVRWQSINPGFPLEETFTVASFRSRPDATGDYVLLDGYNGQGRNPYHCFSILELRLDGHTVLRGHENQLVTKVDGMVEPVVARYAALKRCGVIGRTAFAVAEVPNAAFCRWRRTLVQRIGRYALVVDRLTFRTSSENAEVQTKWWTLPHTWKAETNCLHVTTEEKPAAEFAICPSDPVKARIWRRLAILSRTVAARQGQDVVSFSLIARTGKAKEAAGPACLRLSETSAVVRLPVSGKTKAFQTGLVQAGQTERTQTQLAVLTSSHLFGLQMTEAGLDGVVLRVTKPVDVDWDFAAGTLHLGASEKCRVLLALDPGTRLRLNGKPIDVEGLDDALVALAVPAGQHVLDGARLSKTLVSRLNRRLAVLHVEAQQERAAQTETTTAESAPDVPLLKGEPIAQLDGRIVDLAVVRSKGKTLVAAALGKTVHVVDLGGRAAQTLDTDADIRAIHWWPEPRLLLAGCTDEQVIAFDVDPAKPAAERGRRRWTFTSQMAPWVYTHQASHWWKEAGPHHAGIHGLTSGAFLDKPDTQAIVGSACTIEVLDRDGKLLLRTEQVWGDIVHMIIIPRPDGSRDLLSLRRPSLTSRVNILNSRTLNPNRAGFHGVPKGHTDIKSWGRARYHLFHEDLDGDGTKEVIGEINGPWDRVTVWDESGAAKVSAPFGPGMRSSRSLRDLDVADLDGDGAKEILVATDAGLLVVLDGACRKVWSKRLPAAPTVLAAIVPAGGRLPWIVIGCADGSVLALDGAGKLLYCGRIDGNPDRIVPITRDGTPYALLTTTNGRIDAFRLVLRQR